MHVIREDRIDTKNGGKPLHAAPDPLATMFEILSGDGIDNCQVRATNTSLD